MKPTVLNIPCNKGYVVQDNSGGHGPFLGVYVNYDSNTRECTVTATLEVGNKTFNSYSGTYVFVKDGEDPLFELTGSKIIAGKQRIILQKTHKYIASGHCSITATFNQEANRTNVERWNFTTTPIEFNAQVIPDTPILTTEFKDNKSFSKDELAVRRLYANDDNNTLQTLKAYCNITNNATRYILELWRDDEKIIYSEHNEITYNFSEADRGKKFKLSGWAISSTNDFKQAIDNIWYINDLPIMDAKTVRSNVNITTDEVTLLWNPAIDKYNKDNKITYKVHIRKKDLSNNYKTIGTINVGETIHSQNIKLSNYNVQKGESIYLSVEPVDYLEHSYKLYGDVKVTRNSPPYFSNGSSISSNVDEEPYVGLFKDNITITWNSAFDKENNKILYKIYYSINKNTNNPSWSKWNFLTSTSDTFSIINCQSYVNKGEQIKFGIIANDGLEESCPPNSISITSKVLTRDKAPKPPTQCILYPKKTNEIHYEAIEKIEWNTCKCINGKDCKNYLIEVYTCKDNTKNNSILIYSQTITSTSLTYDISSINRGNYFYFRIYSNDLYNLRSETYFESKLYRRNRTPNPVKNFKINSSKKNFFQTVPLCWDKSSDPDNDPITYTIYFSKNQNSSYEIIANGLTTTTYSHNISHLSSNDHLYYKIITVDKFNVHSPEVLLINSGNIVVNTKPNSPKMLYPNGIIYDKTPRIIFKTTGDINEDNLIIKININGIEYNSATSLQFNKKIYAPKNDVIIFIPASLKEGNNKITIKANDGYEDSIENTYNIIYNKPLLDNINNNDTYITTNIYYNLLTMLNNTRKAYGKSELTKPNLIKSTSYIKTDNYLLLYNGIREVTNYLNTNFPGKNRNTAIANISKNSIITKQIYNSILNNIKNV